MKVFQDVKLFWDEVACYRIFLICWRKALKSFLQTFFSLLAESWKKNFASWKYWIERFIKKCTHWLFFEHFAYLNLEKSPRNPSTRRTFNLRQFEVYSLHFNFLDDLKQCTGKFSQDFDLIQFHEIFLESFWYNLKQRLWARVCLLQANTISWVSSKKLPHISLLLLKCLRLLLHQAPD